MNAPEMKGTYAAGWSGEGEGSFLRMYLWWGLFFLV